MDNFISLVWFPYAVKAGLELTIRSASPSEYSDYRVCTMSASPPQP